MNGLQ